MSTKKTMHKPAAMGRRGASTEDKKPFRKAITAAPLEIAEGKFIGDTSEPKAELVEPAIKKKTPPAPRIVKTPRVSVKPAPWADARPGMTVPFVTRLTDELHMQLSWLKDNLPNTSMQKLIRGAIEKEVAMLLEKHFCT